MARHEIQSLNFMSETVSSAKDAAAKNGSSSAPQVNVFAIHGADPEVQAYAMAKYSRSALSMKESLKELNEQRAEQFLNTFYFQYGHRSIADLAHVAFAIEKLSILAAIILVDEQRWDGQERSTRYQNFKKSGYYVPAFGGDAASAGRYSSTVDFLFSQYEALTQEMLQYYVGQTPRPAEMKEDAYTRTLRARAFDNSRYLLPLGTNTSLGQIVNARTLETQIARLLSSPFAEVQRLGELLKRAATETAFNPNLEWLTELVQEIKESNPELGAKAEQQLLRQTRAAPTLVKYANANQYEIATRNELAQLAAELVHRLPIEESRSVELYEPENLEIEIAATLIYSACHHPFRQVCKIVQGLSSARRDEIIEMGFRHRGTHDELARVFHAGQGLCFDILMDIGGFRDMHRHRRCTQIEQGLTTRHGYDVPEDLRKAGLETRYREAIERSAAVHDELAIHYPWDALYMIPLAFRKRTLFKMDFAEALYIAELRTGEGGHFSYRRVAYEMYEELKRKHPELAGYFRVSDVRKPLDLLRR